MVVLNKLLGEQLRMSNMNIEEILSVLESKDARFDSNSFSTVTIPFPVTPQEYLAFAEEDLKDLPPRGLRSHADTGRKSARNLV